MEEEAKKIMAVVILALAAGILFVSWGKITSSRLTTISPGLNPPSAGFLAQPPEELSLTLHPTAGIIDTLKSIEELWK